MNSKLEIRQSLIKLVGVFGYNAKTDIQKFIQEGFSTQPFISLPDGLSKEEVERWKNRTASHYKNQYYTEFRALMLTGENITDHTGKERINIKALKRERYSSIHLASERGNQIQFNITQEEVYFFPNGIGVFALHLNATETAASSLSDLLVISREFESELISPQPEIHKLKWHQWISKEILSNIPLMGEKVPTDEFSGSKFKTYSIVEIDESKVDTEYNRDHLLFELATCSRLNTIKENGYNAPSPIFYSTLMENKLEAFKNYSVLTILDSFTALGENHYNAQDILKYNTWNKVYFSIYIFNLFIKYNLFKFNAEFLKDPVGYRERFTTFVNNYNYHQISFNFLPNLLYQNARSGLEINQEMSFFEERLSNLAKQIQEEQEKKQALLLGLISLITALDALDTIMNGLGKAQELSGLSNITFYLLLAIIVAFIGIGITRYLYPSLYLKMKRKLFSEKK